LLVCNQIRSAQSIARKNEMLPNVLGNLELLENILEVAFDGLRTEYQHLCDLAVLRPSAIRRNTSASRAINPAGRSARAVIDGAVVNGSSASRVASGRDMPRPAVQCG
jgi:hypothetical protein